MTWRLGYNTGETPLVIDPDGRVIGGRDWAAVDPDTTEVQAAVKKRRIVFPAPPPADGNPHAVAAQDRVDNLNEPTSGKGGDS